MSHRFETLHRSINSGINRGQVGEGVRLEDLSAGDLVAGIDPAGPVSIISATMADEIFVNLQAEGKLEIVIEIRATSAGGFSETTVRTVTENSRVLNFNPGSGFESE